jgi:hypothetical protein
MPYSLHDKYENRKTSTVRKKQESGRRPVTNWVRTCGVMFNYLTSLQTSLAANFIAILILWVYASFLCFDVSHLSSANTGIFKVCKDSYGIMCCSLVRTQIKIAYFFIKVSKREKVIILNIPGKSDSERIRRFYSLSVYGFKKECWNYSYKLIQWPNPRHFPRGLNAWFDTFCCDVYGYGYT